MQTSRVTGKRIKAYLEEGKRFDGRGLDEFREIVIEKNISNKAEGSVRVKIGNTEVLVGVKMAVGAPYPDSPDKGNLMVTAELLPLSSERYEYGPPKFPAIELGRLTDRAIRESKYVDFSKLCIKPGEKVWTVFVDVYSINDDGNLLDAAGIGAVAALKLAKIPKYDEENDKVLFGELTDKGLPLNEEVIPITVHKIGSNLIVDPSLEEEDVSEARITIGADIKGIIHSMQKGESKELTVEEVESMLDISEKVRKQVFSQIEKATK